MQETSCFSMHDPGTASEFARMHPVGSRSAAGWSRFAVVGKMRSHPNAVVNSARPGGRWYRRLIVAAWLVLAGVHSLHADPAVVALERAFEGRPGTFYLQAMDSEESLVFRAPQETVRHPAGGLIGLPLAILALEAGASEKTLEALAAAAGALPEEEILARLDAWAFGIENPEATLITPWDRLISTAELATFFRHLMLGELGIDRGVSERMFDLLLDRNEAGYVLLALPAGLEDGRGAWYAGMVQMRRNRFAFAAWLDAPADAEAVRQVTLRALQYLTNR